MPHARRKRKYRKGRSELDEVVDTEQSQPPAREICRWDTHMTREQVIDLSNWKNSKTEVDTAQEQQCQRNLTHDT